MPVIECQEDELSGWAYEGGKCYTYETGDEAASDEAKRKAHLQGAAIEASMEEQHKEHSKSQCMRCKDAPQIQVKWADGRAGAWFCLKHFIPWTKEDGSDGRDIVGAWALTDGNAVEWPVENLPKVDTKGHSSEEIASRVSDILNKTNDNMKGLYLVAPHGRLVYNGTKTAIAKAKPRPELEDNWIVVSKENGTGLAFGVIEVGAGQEVAASEFKSHYAEHLIDESDRLRWWQDADPLYLYPITSLKAYEIPLEVEVSPGTQTIMEEVKAAMFPLANRDRVWDKGEAEAAVRKWAGAEDEPNAKYATAYMWHDPANPKKFGSYKMGFTTTVDGTMKAIPKGIFAIAAVLQGARGGVDIPADARPAIMRKVEAYYATMRQKFEDNSIKVPWERGSKAEDTVECPECGALNSVEAVECEVCGTEMERAEVVQVAVKETPQLDITEQPTYNELDIKAGRRVQQAKLNLLQEIVKKGDAALTSLQDEIMTALKDFIKWAKHEEDEPGEPPRKVPRSILDVITGTKEIATHGAAFAFKAKDGTDWWMQWTTNAFRDREREIFTTQSIKDYVERHSSDDLKGQFWFWHVPGTKFATVKWQAVVGRFLVQAGPFDDTPVAESFKSFFAQYPDGHPKIAPKGWGTSHGYFFNERDREDGVYETFEIKESTVLPWSKASNQFSPTPRIIQEVKEMDQEQKEALSVIVGTENADAIEIEGDKLTKELEDGGIDFKEVATTEEVAEVKEVEPEEVVEPEPTDVVVEEVKEEVEEVKEEVVEPAPAYLTQSDFLEGVKLITETLRDEFAKALEAHVVALDDKIAAVSTSVETTQAEEHAEIKQQIADTPAASFIDTLTSVIGRKEVKVTEKEAEKMGAPKETPVPEPGMMFWEREGWTQ